MQFIDIFETIWLKHVKFPLVILSMLEKISRVCIINMLMIIWGGHINLTQLTNYKYRAMYRLTCASYVGIFSTFDLGGHL